MKPSVLARIASQLSKTSAIVDAVEQRLVHTAGSREFVAPVNETEQAIAGIWATLIRVERVGRADNFFQLGGHSLLATQMMSRVWERFAVELPLVTIFTRPTLEAFAEVVAGAALGTNQAQNAMAPLVRTERPARLPLSYGQQRLWFLDQLQPGSSFYNVTLKWRLRGSLNQPALAKALDEIVVRHESLRTRFTGQGEEVSQQVMSAQPGLLRTVDLTQEHEFEREKHAATLVAEEARKPFDLEQGPPFRATLLRLGENDHVLALSIHHIVSDGWSFGLLRHEISALYEAFAAGQPSPLPELPLQYADFALWQRTHLQGEAFESQLRYWKEQLREAPPSIELPADLSRPAVQTYRGTSETIVLSQHLLADVKELAQAEGTTLFMALLSAFYVLLSRLSGQEDLVVGSAIAGRTQRETESLIGLFVNTLALRAHVHGKDSFRALLRQVREMATAAYAHQDVPFERLVEQLNPVRDSSRSPLYQVMLILQNTPTHKAALGDVQMSSFGSTLETSQMDLLLNLIEQPGGLTASMTYNTDLYHAETIQRMLAQYGRLLEAAVQNADCPVAEMPLLTESERSDLVVDLNATFAVYESCCVHEAISSVCVAHADRTAVLFGLGGLSYGELESGSNQLAHYLCLAGVVRGSLVGVYLERSLDLMVALLGVMKAGAAYVPLDPHYPAQRVEAILEDAGVVCVLSTGALAGRLPDASRIVLLEEAAIGLQPVTPVASGVTSEDLAYVIFTSGSTGRPKGVEVRHRSVVNLLSSLARELSVGERTVFPALASFAFDMSVPELFLPLFTGGTLALGESHLAGNGEDLAGFLVRHGATIVHATPTTWSLLLDAGFTGAGLTRCIGAEPLPQGLFERLMRSAPGTALVNLYGPTETTVWSTLHRFETAEEAVVVGRPLANTQVYVLDAQGQVCPVGVTGEIYIAGDGVARGYLGRADLTAAQFLPNPFDESSASSASRMYRTADLGRWTSLGTLEHLGRADFQVKIRGYRIELGEIEVALTGCPGVREAVAAVREDTPGDKRLVAYVVLAPEAVLDTAEVRLRLQTVLPDYMVPSAFVALDRMPLTLNGKINRKQMPQPELKDSGATSGQVPRTPTELFLAETWATVLRVPAVYIEDDFFQLGGHSLLATQMVSRVRQHFKLELPLVKIFSHPTLEAFALVIDLAIEGGEGAALTPLVRIGERPAHVPLSYGQQRLWFLDQLEPGSSFYNVVLKWRLCGALDQAALEAALNEIVTRHESLRTTFGLSAGEPVQIVSPVRPVALEFGDLRTFPEIERESAARARVAEEARRPFDLARGPLFRALLLKLGEREHALVLNTHHIVTDGWSSGLLRHELLSLYEAFAAGRPSPLPALPLQYADFALWQRTHLEGAVLDHQMRYWSDHLRGAPPSIELPTDRLRPAMQTYRGASRGLRLPADLVMDMKALSQKQGATFYMTLLAGFYLLLSRLSGQQDIVIGSAIAGRTHSDTEKLVGLFVNTLALRTQIDEEQTFIDLLRRVRETTIHAFANQDVPFERLVSELNPVRDSSRSPLYQVMLVLQNTPPQAGESTGLEITSFGSALETSQMDLLLNLVEHPEGVAATIIYNIDLFDEHTIDRMLRQYRHLLEEVVRDAAVPTAHISLLDPGELEQITVTWNETQSPYPRESCLHTLFEAQAALHPQAIALSFRDQRFSYGELDILANRLAHHLQARGVKTCDRVGIYLERTPEMIVVLLAVLKVGAAYVPLDPAYPEARLQIILEDAEVSCLVTRAELKTQLSHYGGPAVLLDTDAQAITAAAPGPVSAGVSSADLAYVIFTSGSTGRPKGVEVPHHAVVNLLTWMAEELSFGPQDVFPALASVGFDMSVPELFLALSAGGTVALGEADLAGNGEELAAFLRTHKATVVHATPTTWTLLLDTGFTGTGLKRCVGAEPLPQHLFERLMMAAPGTPLWNFYGPTETTVWSTYHCFTSIEEAIVVGRPLANTQVYLLDRSGEVCPVGVPGEIYIAGDGLAHGYRGRPDLSAEKFVPNPFSTSPDARMYRTADLGRWTVEGNIEHLGRADFQVKIRGYRIELGEIEAVLTALPGIREAVVVAREDTPGDKRLAAYIVTEASRQTELDTSMLRARLKETLPDYMVPLAFVPLDRLPLTPNGKVDRLRLPAPVAYAGSVTAGGKMPRTRMQVLLADIWMELLKTPQVHIEDDFFQLGGHSLLAATMITRLSEALGYRVQLASLFASPTLGALAASAEAQGFEQQQLTAVVPIRRTGTKPPLFCVSRPNVNALGFVFLSRAVSPALPIYGLQSNMENDGVLAPFTQAEYEEKAAEYIVAMREVQPEGPYFLIGYCEGAHIAFEIGRQLEQMGLEVGGIFILDVWPIENTISRTRFIMRNYGRVVRRFLHASSSERLAIVMRKLHRGSAIAPQELIVDKNVFRNPDFDHEGRKHLSRVAAARYWPGKDFKPMIYGGSLVIFRIHKQPFHRIKDETLGWRPRVLGEIDLVYVPGEHSLILRAPGVDVVGRELEARIDAYLAGRKQG